MISLKQHHKNAASICDHIAKVVQEAIEDPATLTALSEGLRHNVASTTLIRRGLRHPQLAQIGICIGENPDWGVSVTTIGINRQLRFSAPPELFTGKFAVQVAKLRVHWKACAKNEQMRRSKAALDVHLQYAKRFARPKGYDLEAVQAHREQATQKFVDGVLKQAKTKPRK